MTVVVAGVIARDGRLLICQRRAGMAHPLKWEFPGGKVEAEEDAASALRRELEEELNIAAEVGAEVARYRYRYPGRQAIELVFLKVERFAGVPENRIFEQIAWVLPGELANYDFLEGDTEFIRRLGGGCTI